MKLSFLCVMVFILYLFHFILKTHEFILLLARYVFTRVSKFVLHCLHFCLQFSCFKA